MSRSIQTTELTSIIASLKDPKTQSKADIIKELLLATQQGKVHYIPLSITELLSALSPILESPKINDTIESLHLINELANKFPKESNENMNIIIKNLVKLMAQEHVMNLLLEQN